MKRFLPPVWVAALLALATTCSLAADSGGGSDALSDAREHIAGKRFDAALESLRQVNDPGNPDWQNLMGYSLRRSKTPDRVAAQKHYDTALRIDPSHRGALVYSGELALLKGDLSTAEQRLARLDKVCARKCTEYLDLDDAIQRYKANGNKHVGW
jgi:Flp pilus assembly protein TadD